MGRRGVLIFLFLPAVLNFAISSAIGWAAARSAYARGLPPGEIGREVTVAIFTYNFYWSVLQVGFGLWAVRLMGGWGTLKRYYTRDDLLTPRALILTLLLVAFSQGVIMGLQLATALAFYGGWGRYYEVWRGVVSRLPLASKVYLALIAPFTAGVFEEIVWRLYGITSLERYWTPGRANLVQALAFALWHGLSLHTLATFVIGYVYGLVFIRRRRLLLLTAAHVLTDLVGFGHLVLVG